MKEDLLLVKKVLDKHKTKFFLIYGTALGAYRDGDFLPGDYDVDLGTFDNTHFEEIRKDLEAEGFEIGVCYNVDTKEEIPAKMILSERNTRVDIYHFEKSEDEYVAWKHSFSKHPFLSMPLKFKKLENVKFLGKKFLIPADTEEYLEFLYGDWKSREKKQGRLYAEIHGLPKELYV